jgi:endoglucanase
MDARARWTEAVVRDAEARNISWAYWEFGSGFGIYDPRAKIFRDALVKALLPTRSGR